MVREMKHTEIGDIPTDWELQTFEETFRILSNNTLPRAELNKRGGLVRNVHYGDVLTRFTEMLDCQQEDIPYINDLSLLSSTTQLLQDGDVIIADTAEDETVGKATEVFGLGKGRMVAGLHTIPCRVKKGEFAPGWLGYYMNSHVYHNQILPFITGIKVSSISKSAIAETLIAIPPKEEQEAIVSAFLSIDRLILTLSKQIDKELYLKKGLVQSLLHAENRLSGFESDWITQELQLFADVINGDRGENYPKDTEMVTFGIPFINAGHLQNGKIVFSSMEYISRNQYDKMGGAKLKAGDILFCLRGSLGKYAMVNFDEGAPASSLCVIRCQKNMKPEYLYQMLGSEIVKKLIEDTNSGSSQPNLSADNVKHFVFSYPSDKTEQQTIIEICNDADLAINRVTSKRNKYIKIKQGMMSELLTGKIRLV